MTYSIHAVEVDKTVCVCMYVCVCIGGGEYIQKTLTFNLKCKLRNRRKMIKQTVYSSLLCQNSLQICFIGMTAIKPSIAKAGYTRFTLYVLYCILHFFPHKSKQKLEIISVNYGLSLNNILGDKYGDHKNSYF